MTTIQPLPELARKKGTMLRMSETEVNQLNACNAQAGVRLEENNTVGGAVRRRG